MDAADRDMLVDLYEMGMPIREIVDVMGGACGRDKATEALKEAGVRMRGSGTRYADPSSFCGEDAELFAELLGYLYGDGHISKVMDSKNGRYESLIAFSLDEDDLVERVRFIVYRLFGFHPRVITMPDHYRVRLRRGLARRLYEFGFPVGKKSLLNPSILLKFLSGGLMGAAFLRGFFNAEASVNKTVSVHQSVRFFPDDRVRHKVIALGKPYAMKNTSYRTCAWTEVKHLLEDELVSSNILLGVKELLSRLGVSSRIYPVRVHISGQKRFSVHYELRILTKCLKRVADSGLLSSRKKTRKLSHILARTCRSGQTGMVQGHVA